MIKVSVIVPVYNVEPYVRACLDSVQRQTFTDLEIICIHDAGCDQSWEIVKEAAAQDQRIRLWENKRNLGLAATRNRGLDLAKGKYVYFLDSDDMIRPDALEKLYDRAEAEQLEVQIFGAAFLYESKELEEKFRSNPAGFRKKYPEVMNGRELFVEWMKVWDWMPSQPRYFYKRSFLEEFHIRYPEGMLHEDEICAFDVLMYARRVKVSDDAFFIRRFRAGSIMTGVPTIRNVEGCINILEHAASLQRLYADDPALNAAVKYYMYKIFRDACRKYRAAAGTGWTARRLQPERTIAGETRADAAKEAMYHLIEACGLWEEL